MFDAARRWLRIPPARRPRFDEILQEACDEPLMVVSAQAMLQSLSSPSECGSDLHCDGRR